jgi:hypothetical protein
VVAVTSEAPPADGDEARGEGPVGDASTDPVDRPERDARPPALAVVLSLVAAGVASLAALLAAPLGGALLGGATVALAAGSLRRSHRLLSWAAGIGVVGLAVAGYRGGGVEALLVGGVALAVAWDVADHGLSVGEQVGRGARTRRNVAVHAGATLLAGALSVGVVYGVYRAAAGSRPVAALALLLFGAVVLASALR